MVVVAQSVERRFVEPEVAGAEPVSHPRNLFRVISYKKYANHSSTSNSLHLATNSR